MNGNKLFAASIAILALALGFFLGTLKGSCCAPCEHSAMNAPCDCTKGLPCSCEKNGQPCHCPNCAKHDHKGPHGDFDKGPKFKGPNFAAIDSLLQVTPEQKAAIEASRVKGDSVFKVLRQQKHEAERALGEALESKDAAGIDAAKAKVQERTPVFTVVQGAAVPIKASNPKRMLFVLGMLILAFFGTSFYLVRKDLHFSF